MLAFQPTLCQPTEFHPTLRPLTDSLPLKSAGSLESLCGRCQRLCCSPPPGHQDSPTWARRGRTPAGACSCHPTKFDLVGILPFFQRSSMDFSRRFSYWFLFAPVGIRIAGISFFRSSTYFFGILHGIGRLRPPAQNPEIFQFSR